MTLYKNKYRIESARLKGWDYSSPGYYFITICTKNRECLFGNVVRGEIVLSEMGTIAEQYWREIPIHFNGVKLDEFVIMPNHIHGIISIENPPIVETPNLGVSTGTVNDTGTDNDTGTVNDKKNTPNIGIIINTNESVQSIFVVDQTPEYRSGNHGFTIISCVMKMN